MELIQQKKHHVWYWPAVANFILGGMATGLYMVSLFMEILMGEAFSTPDLLMFRLLSPLLLSLGFLTLTFEAGRPLRGYHLLRNLRTSWMSREMIAGGIFILSALLDWICPYMVLKILAATSALVLLISQGFIVYRSRAVTSWNVPLMPILFLTSGFALGAGLTLLLSVLSDLNLGLDFIATGLIILILDVAVWLTYLFRNHDSSFREATDFLRRPAALIRIIGIGHVLPILLLSPFLWEEVFDAGITSRKIILAFAGLTILAGGVRQKVYIVLWANYLRGIVMGQPKENRQM